MSIPGSGGMPNLSNFPEGFYESWTGSEFTYHEGKWTDYTWLMVIGTIVSFFAAWSIGANDVANSFATSVGAKSVTMFQACIIAGVFEFVGAVSLGGSVTKTVKGSITNPKFFEDEPQIFAYGMVCAATAIGVVLTLATYLRQAVSTTHTAIGSVLGFGLVYGGANAITWNEEQDEFPYRKGFTPVVISWFVSPIFTAIVSFIVFFWTRFLVMRRENSYRLAFYALPPLVMVTIFIVLLAVLLKGVSQEELPWDEDKKAWVSIIVGAGCGCIAIPYVIWLRKKMFAEDDQIHQEGKDRDAEAAHIAAGGAAKEKMVDEEREPTWAEKFMTRFNASWFGRLSWTKNFVAAMTYDVHAHVATLEDPRVAKLHADAEVFDPRTEDVFKHLQVVTASAVAFVHGANDVANGVGPLAGIWEVYNNFTSGSGEAKQPRWILVIGAFGIVFGLAMYGYRIIATLGVDLVVMTPSRGYSAELAATVIIALASTYGLPVSTTQVITGGEIGVGLLESWKCTGVNWMLFVRTFFGWVGALVCGALVSGCLFAIGVYGPSLTNMDYVLRYQDAMGMESRDMMNALVDNCANGQTWDQIRANAQYQTDGKFDSSLLPTTNCAPVATPTTYSLSNLYTLNDQLEGLFKFGTNGEINQYNMIYVFTQISGLFGRTFSAAFTNTQADSPENHMYPEAETLM